MENSQLPNPSLRFYQDYFSSYVRGGCITGLGAKTSLIVNKANDTTSHDPRRVTDKSSYERLDGHLTEWTIVLYGVLTPQFLKFLFERQAEGERGEKTGKGLGERKLGVREIQREIFPICWFTVWVLTLVVLITSLLHQQSSQRCLEQRKA